MNLKVPLLKSRRLIIAAAHLALVICAYILAFYLRFDFKIDNSHWQVIFKTIPILACIKIVIFGYFGLYSGLWSSAGLDDIRKILKAHVLAALCFISAVVFLYTFVGFPRSIFVLDFILSLCFIAGVRFAYRLVRNKSHPVNGLVDKIFVLLFSAGIAWFIIFSAYYRHSIKPVLLVSCISLIIISFREKKSRLSAFFAQYFSSRYAPFVFFGLSVLVSTIFSKDFWHSEHIFVERYILYFIIFEIGRRFFVSKTVARILDESFGINIFGAVKYIFIIAGLLMGIGGIVDYIRFHPGRLFSVFGYEIQFLMLPLYISYFLPVVYCFMFKGNTFPQRISAILTFVMLVMCMIFTGSRVAWIAGPVSILFVSFLIDKKHLKYFIPGFLIYLYLIYFFLPIRMSDFTTYFPRKDIMLAAVGIFRDNILLGAGPGMYEKLVSKYSPGFIELHAHNTYLEILAELGIVGLTAFLAIFIDFYSRVFKNLAMLKGSVNKFLYTGLLASNAACLIYALFGSIITVGFHDAPMFWLIFGMSFGLENVLSGKGSIK